MEYDTPIWKIIPVLFIYNYALEFKNIESSSAEKFKCELINSYNFGKSDFNNICLVSYIKHYQ